MLRGWRTAAREKRLRRIREATGADELTARTIEAVETGRIHGDVVTLDEEGREVWPPRLQVDDAPRR